MDSEQTILEGYLVRAASSLRHRNLVGSPKVVRCDVCGDSRTQPGATSAAMLLSGDRWVYKCQRTGCEFHDAKLAVRWLWRNHPFLAREYKAELDRLGFGDREMMAKLEARKREAERLAELRAKENEAMDMAEYGTFRPLRDSDSEHVSYLRKRTIDPKSYPFLVTDDPSCRFHGCVIMPAVEAGRAVYWQGRKMRNDGGPKYLNKRNGKQGFLMRTPRLDEASPVIVCEGPFSALSAENSVCTFGANMTARQTEALNAFAKPVYCFDNDWQDKDRPGEQAGTSKMNDLVRKGCWVLIWERFLKKMRLGVSAKDMNDVASRIGRKVLWDDISDCVSDNYYDVQISMF